MLAPRDISRWNKVVHYYDEIGKFESDQFKGSGIYTIKSCGLFFDLLVFDRGKNTTLVYFHPAINSRRDKKLPFFVGGNVCGEHSNVVLVSDPTLGLSQQLSLGWYAGTASCPVQLILKHLLDLIIMRLGGNRVIFSGISGGGFASLYFSYFYPNSLAVPINPQTNISNFTWTTVSAYIKKAYGVESDQDVKTVLATKFTANVGSLYRTGLKNYIIYIQNSSDHHVNLHLNPFLEALEGTSYRSRIAVILSKTWGQGHIAPPIEQQQIMYQKIAMWSGTWEELIVADEVNLLL